MQGCFCLFLVEMAGCFASFLVEMAGCFQKRVRQEILIYGAAHDISTIDEEVICNIEAEL
jgi:hypothetical protein